MHDRRHPLKRSDGFPLDAGFGNGNGAGSRKDYNVAKALLGDEWGPEAKAAWKRANPLPTETEEGEAVAAEEKVLRELGAW